MKCKVNDETFQVLLLFFAFFLLMNCLHFASHWLWRMRQYVSLMLNYLFLVKGVAKRLKAVLNDASSLLDFYYSIGSLVLIKVTSSNFLEWSLHFWNCWFFLNIDYFLLVLHSYPPDFEPVLYPIFMGEEMPFELEFTGYLTEILIYLSKKQKKNFEISPVPFKSPFIDAIILFVFVKLFFCTEYWCFWKGLYFLEVCNL